MISTQFKCDICGEYFDIRDEKGAPCIVGGLEGAYKHPDGSIDKISFDFCDKCYEKIINFINTLKNEHRK